MGDDDYALSPKTHMHTPTRSTPTLAPRCAHQNRARFSPATARSAALLLFSLLGSRAAEAQDLFGETGIYDATGADWLQGQHLDYASIYGEQPGHAQLRGLAGPSTTEVRRNFVYLHDADGTLTIPFRMQAMQFQMDLFAALNFSLRELYKVEPDEFTFVYLFTSFRTGVGAYFYEPEANTTMGIGQMPFRRSTSPREGFVFMNYWRSFDETFGRGGAALVRGQSRMVFNQEAGHRWSAFVQTATTPRGRDVLRGRMQSHWSYFLDSGGSPMEGNAWRDNGNGTFTTVTTIDNWKYSGLDLYLMGLIPPAEVAPFFVITRPMLGTARDVHGQPITSSSPPQVPALGRPVTIGGQRVDLSIQDVITKNGTRSPRAGTAPTRWRAVFVMLASQTTPLSESERVRFESMVDGYAAGFKEGTGNRGELDYALMATPKLPLGATCVETAQCDAMQSTVCLTIPPLQPRAGLCTKPCASASECPSDFCCQPASSGVKVCLNPDNCQPEPAPDAGSPDAADSNPSGNGPDGGIAAQTCACDTTSACDLDSKGYACACDPECKNGLTTNHGGCACIAAAPARSNGGGFDPRIAGPALAVLVAGGLFARRWRKRPADRS